MSRNKKGFSPLFGNVKIIGSKLSQWEAEIVAPNASFRLDCYYTLLQKFRTKNNLFPLKKYLTYVRKKVSKFNKVTDMDEKEIQT